jgi:hypothetical protein
LLPPSGGMPHPTLLLWRFSDAMKKAISSIILVPILALAAYAQQYKSAPAGAPPSDLAPAVASLLSSDGVKITKSDGSAVLEVWLRKAAPTGAGNTGEGVTLPSVPTGAVLGVIKLEAKGEDRRGQSLKPGLYTIRYALMPNNGDHLGAAPQRDFALLVPTAEDKDPNSTPDFDTVVKMSDKASGTAHPAVLSIASGSGTAGFTKEGDRDWTLNGKIGDLPIAIILLGRAES